MAGDPAPWPRLRHTWWVFGLALLALVLFVAGFVVQLRCLLGRCPPTRLGRLLDLDAVGGLPRLFTTALFVGVAVLALRAWDRRSGRAAAWWAAVAVLGIGLAVAKLVSVHSAVKSGLSPVATLLLGSALAVPVVGALWLTGRRWQVAGTRPVVVALAVYAGTALGLEVLISSTTLVLPRVGPLIMAALIFAEELSEGLTALLILVVVRWQVPAGRGEAELSGRRP